MDDRGSIKNQHKIMVISTCAGQHDYKNIKEERI